MLFRSIELLVKLHLNLHQTIDLRLQLNLQLDLGPTDSLHPHNRTSIPLERHGILYHLRHLWLVLFCLFFSSYLLLLDHLANCWIILLTVGFWLCSQVHLLGGLKAESFNQLVERARMQLARTPKVVNDNLEDVKVSTTFLL